MCLDRRSYFPRLLHARLLAAGHTEEVADAVAAKVQRAMYGKAVREGLVREPRSR